MKLPIIIFAILVLFLWIAAGSPSIDHMLHTAGVL